MKLKEGDILCCELEEGCGIEVKGTKLCGCVDCDIICCGKQMTKKEEKEPSSYYAPSEPCNE